MKIDNFPFYQNGEKNQMYFKVGECQNENIYRYS